MSRPLINKLESYLPLSISDKMIIEDLSMYVKFKSGYVFQQSNSVSENFALVINGVFRYYQIDDLERIETTTHFAKENDFVVKLDSFHDRKLSNQTIQAITSGEMLVITHIDYLKLNERIPGFNKAIVSLANDFLVDFAIFHRKLIDLQAKERYAAFMERYPTILNRVKLAYVASFLGITQSTLSRIRKEVYQKKLNDTE